MCSATHSLICALSASRLKPEHEASSDNQIKQIQKKTVTYLM